MISVAKASLMGEGITRGRYKFIVAFLFVVILVTVYVLRCYISENKGWIEKHDLLEIRLKDMTFKATTFQKKLLSCQSDVISLKAANDDLIKKYEKERNLLQEALKEVNANNNKYMKSHEFYQNVKALLGKASIKDPNDGNIPLSTYAMLKDTLSKLAENATALQRKNGALESRIQAVTSNETRLQTDLMACDKKLSEALKRQTTQTTSCQDKLREAEDKIHALQVQLDRAPTSFDEHDREEDDLRGISKTRKTPDRPNVVIEYLGKHDKPGSRDRHKNSKSVVGSYKPVTLQPDESDGGPSVLKEVVAGTTSKMAGKQAIVTVVPTTGPISTKQQEDLGGKAVVENTEDDTDDESELDNSNVKRATPDGADHDGNAQGGTKSADFDAAKESDRTDEGEDAENDEELTENAVH